LTAKNKTFVDFTISRLDALVVAPVSFAKLLQAAGLGSLALTWFGATILARINPFASAVAIFPAPRNPMVSFAGMGGL
jgi:hypothetical protein